MTNPTNWPNPERPGEPLFPERDGWHVIMPIGRLTRKSRKLAFWSVDEKEWDIDEDEKDFRSMEYVGEKFSYRFSAFTPAQINEMLAAERERIIAEALPKILVDLAELPDRTSPETAPDLLMATVQEIEQLASNAIRNLGAAP